MSGPAILPHQQINLWPLIQKTQSPFKTPLKKNKIDNLRIGILLTVLSCLLIFSQKKIGRPHFPSDQREQTKSKFSENWQFGKLDSSFWCLISKFENPLIKCCSVLLKTIYAELYVFKFLVLQTIWDAILLFLQPAIFTSNHEYKRNIRFVFVKISWRQQSFDIHKFVVNLCLYSIALER